MSSLILVGIFVNGPYALITTAVCAELGTHESLEGNAKALATVTAIVDGTGSIGEKETLKFVYKYLIKTYFPGAAVGPLLAGYLQSFGWQYVFWMLIFSDVFSLLCLLRLTKNEMSKYIQIRRQTRIE